MELGATFFTLLEENLFPNQIFEMGVELNGVETFIQSAPRTFSGFRGSSTTLKGFCMMRVARRVSVDRREP